MYVCNVSIKTRMVSIRKHNHTHTINIKVCLVCVKHTNSYITNTILIMNCAEFNINYKRRTIAQIISLVFFFFKYIQFNVWLWEINVFRSLYSNIRKHRNYSLLSYQSLMFQIFGLSVNHTYRTTSSQYVTGRDYCQLCLRFVH